MDRQMNNDSIYNNTMVVLELDGIVISLCIAIPVLHPSPGVMDWILFLDFLLFAIASILNSHRFMSKTLEPVVVFYLQDPPAVIFLQDNVRHHTGYIYNVQQFFKPTRLHCCSIT
ncbi:hypothetical protein TNCV_1319781 [Trichonephila clavipes]|nr:hypothetical protein TNCV_1319781 [Trichonephila clavipes]